MFESAKPDNIPLCEPNLCGNERQYTIEALDSNWLSSGSFLNKFERSLAEYTGAGHVVGVSSGTTALQISMILAGVIAHDLVFAPNLTFVATVNSIKHVGADPILVDVALDTWLMDLNLLEYYLEENSYTTSLGCYCKHTNRRISAVVVVHLLGNICDLSRLVSITEKYRLKLIEDAACSLGSIQNNTHSGTTGLLGTLSFNSNKIITTAGGGAILTNDEYLAKRARYLITQAKMSSIEYFHDSLGYNYRLVNPLAAIGLAQMELLSDFIEKKQEIYHFYLHNLQIPVVNFQKISLNTQSNFWHTAMLFERSRELISFLSARNIESRPIWVPINELPVFSNDVYITEQKNSQSISGSGIMLPSSTSITNEQLKRVSAAINEFYKM